LSYINAIIIYYYLLIIYIIFIYDSVLYIKVFFI